MMKINDTPKKIEMVTHDFNILNTLKL